MSKENAKRFLEELAHSEALQKGLNELNPSSPEELISFADRADFLFNKDEMKEAMIDFGALIISDDELESVAGGAEPNVGQANTGVLGEAPGMAMGNFYQSIAQALADAMYNATTAQQQMNIVMQTATTMRLSPLIQPEQSE